MLAVGRRGTFYHGTSTVLAKRILSEGFVPDPQRKIWDGETGVQRSYAGTYFTSRISTANRYADGAVRKFGGLPVVFEVQLETRTGVFDEDEIAPVAGAVLLAAADARDIRHLTGETAARLLGGPRLNGLLDDVVQRWIGTGDEDYRAQRFAQLWRNRYGDAAPHPRYIEAVLKAVRAAALAFIEDVAETGSTDGGSRYRQANTRLMRALNVSRYGPQPRGSWTQNIRITEPVRFRGANRILAAVVRQIDVNYRDDIKTNTYWVLYGRPSAALLTDDDRRYTVETIVRRGWPRKAATMKTRDERRIEAEKQYDVGFSWESVNGIRKIVDIKDGKALVQTGDRKIGAQIIPVSDLESEIAFDQKQLASRQKQRAAKEKRRSDEEAERQKRENTYGFTDRMSPPRRAKALQALLRNVKFSDGLMSIKQKVERLHQQGWTTREHPKFKRIAEKDNRFLTQRDLTKTGLDYLDHLNEKNPRIVEARHDGALTQARDELAELALRHRGATKPGRGGATIVTLRDAGAADRFVDEVKRRGWAFDRDGLRVTVWRGAGDDVRRLFPVGSLLRACREVTKPWASARVRQRPDGAVEVVSARFTGLLSLTRRGLSLQTEGRQHAVSIRGSLKRTISAALDALPLTRARAIGLVADALASGAVLRGHGRFGGTFEARAVDGSYRCRGPGGHFHSRRPREAAAWLVDDVGRAEARRAVVLARMSVEEAARIFGLSTKELGDPARLKRRYRELSLQHHPDRGGDAQQMKLVNLAYERLKTVRPGTVRPEDDPEADALAQQIENALERNLRVDAFTKHFEKIFGKTFVPRVQKQRRGRGRFSSVSLDVEWRSTDDETIFTLGVWSDVSGATRIRQLTGGDPDVSFKISVVTSVEHQNRKSKFKRRDWESTTSHAALRDPKVLFPTAKIKKMMAGKEKARKFSRRDMQLGLKNMGARIEREWAYVPVGDATVVMWRSVLMRTAGWSPNSVYRRVDKKIERYGVKEGGKMATGPETEDLLAGLKRIQKTMQGKPLKALYEAVVDAMNDAMAAAIAREKAGR